MADRLTLMLGGEEIQIETGEIARQANGAVIVRQRDTVVLVTAVTTGRPRADLDYFPLNVEYRERMAASGRIPGGYGRRERRQGDHEVLASRLIDRSIRPLFPKAFRGETQVLASVLSADPEAEPEALALLGAAAALQLSDIPWQGPLAGLRVALVGDRFTLNPTRADRLAADLDFVVSLNDRGLVMLEGACREVTEDVVLEALDLASRTASPLLAALDAWCRARGKEKMALPESESVPDAVEDLVEAHGAGLRAALDEPAKQARRQALAAAREEIVEELGRLGAGDPKALAEALDRYQARLVRERILVEGKRLDGRGLEDVRPISIRVGWLPRAHGSALFTRGETQAMVTCTLGGAASELRYETVYGSESERFMLHYNFPPYSVGEVRPLRGPGRREIGHGYLARKALAPVLPEQEEFDYTIRVVSDISESNGSSSMATVCGGTLAMMDAGVPLRRPVAGIAMGLIAGAARDDETPGRVAILSDIMGDEDHLGDMDFKVAGTTEGITAMQLDNKIGALPREVMARALEQARAGRLHILDCMAAVLARPRDSVSRFAPTTLTLHIRPNQRRAVIGPGGSVVQGIQAETDARISIDEEGRVRITAPDGEAAERAREMIAEIVREPVVGEVIEGTVTKVVDFGAFVRLFGSTEALLHISEYAPGRTESLAGLLAPGDTVRVKVLGVDHRGRIKLSRRAALQD